MINNISNVDARMQQQMSVAKATPSVSSVQITPILSFKTPFIKEKATLRVKKFKRGDNIIISGEIDDDYVDIVEENTEALTSDKYGGTSFNFFQLTPEKKKTKFLKNCYVVDYIQSPKARCGLGTEALKGLAEKAMFDSKAEGRIVTFSSPVWRESSPALFFYKLGFRFMNKSSNEYMQECLIKKVPDIPPQIGMMYLPKSNLHKLLRYGELF
jgi:hypothetical protein